MSILISHSSVTRNRMKLMFIIFSLNLFFIRFSSSSWQEKLLAIIHIYSTIVFYLFISNKILLQAFHIFSFNKSFFIVHNNYYFKPFAYSFGRSILLLLSFLCKLKLRVQFLKNYAITCFHYRDE